MACWLEIKGCGSSLNILFILAGTVFFCLLVDLQIEICDACRIFNFNSFQQIAPLMRQLSISSTHFPAVPKQYPFSKFEHVLPSCISHSASILGLFPFPVDYHPHFSLLSFLKFSRLPIRFDICMSSLLCYAVHYVAGGQRLHEMVSVYLMVFDRTEHYHSSKIFTDLKFLSNIDIRIWRVCLFRF